MPNKLLDKISNPKQSIIFYELTPPPHYTNQKSIRAYVKCAIELFSSVHITIDAVNIPEIRSENSKNANIKRAESYVPKINIGTFSDLLRDFSNNNLEIILNRCTVYDDWAKQIAWFNQAIEKHHIHTFILVGGESSQNVYSGPSVIEMGQYIQNIQTRSLLCGGIVIPSRRHVDSALDEPNRIINKIKNGLRFFTTQVIYDKESVINLLRDYAALAKQLNITPGRVLLSFAPIATKKDMDFLRWLGVIIPKETEELLFETDIGVGWRSVKITISILNEILIYLKENNIQIPIGLNIEHINRHNFEITKELITELGDIYLDYLNKI